MHLLHIPVVTPSLDFQDEVTDLDSGNNSVHTFHLMSLGIYPEALRNKLPSAPLSLSSDGIIRTNTIFQSDMSGYILMDVSAQDSDGKMANASLRVRVDFCYYCRGLKKSNCYVVEKVVNCIHLFRYIPYMVKLWYISSQTIHTCC